MMYAIQIMLSVTLLLPALLMGAVVPPTAQAKSSPSTWGSMLGSAIAKSFSSNRSVVEGHIKAHTFEEAFPDQESQVGALSEVIRHSLRKMPSEHYRLEQVHLFLQKANERGIIIPDHIVSEAMEAVNRSKMTNDGIMNQLTAMNERRLGRIELILGNGESNRLARAESTGSPKPNLKSDQEELKNGEGADEI